MVDWGYSIEIGKTNSNSQVVIAETGLPGSDHLQKIFILGCTHCGFIYGANGSDCWQRKCPDCQGGKPGERFKPAKASQKFGGLDKTALGKRLEELRKAKHYSTVRAFEAASGINRGSINDIEKGRNYPSYPTFEKWLSVCDTSAEQFFSK